VIPAALAVAEQRHASGRELVAAVAVGLEICVRLGMAGYDAEAGNSLYFAHGQHATSICGTLAAAVAAAMLHGLPPAGVTHALGVAASMAAGIIEGNRTGGTVKRMHCGWAAHAGVTAAELVARGITGPPTVLEGRFGFFEAFLHGHYDPAPVTDALGEVWAVPEIFFKPYPANHFTHAGIDAALALRAQGLHPDELAEARLGVAGPTVATIGAPIEVKQAPETGYQAQFSGPYTVVAALIGGGGLGLGLADFTDALATDPYRRALMARVRVEADPWCEEIYPYQFPAVLTVRTADGRELRQPVAHNRGGPGAPLSGSELTAKFHDNAARSVDEPAASRLAALAMTVDELADVADLYTDAVGSRVRTGGE
jgi:2-methylcitrate dehydratase PrpD